MSDPVKPVGSCLISSFAGIIFIWTEFLTEQIIVELFLAHVNTIGKYFMDHFFIPGKHKRKWLPGPAGFYEKIIR
jgi:hypothetical protein